MTSLANPTSFSIIPYPSGRNGITVVDNPRAQELSDALDGASQRMSSQIQRDADTSFGKGVVQFVSKPSSDITLTSEEKTANNRKKFNELFEGNLYGNINDFEKQVLKNDYEQKFMNGIGYWEALLHVFIKEGSKTKYGLGSNEAGKYQSEFMQTELGKNIERDLKNYYKNVIQLRQNKDKQAFHNAIGRIVDGIPKYWESVAKDRKTWVELGGGGSKKTTTHKYKNRKKSNRNRTTKNKRRYSRRK
jgi:hypothetical protein